MYAIQKSGDQQPKCQANILPCCLNHNGPVNASKRYWSPNTSRDGQHVSYFRGRKLHGKSVKVPEGYKGVILSSTDRKLPQEPQTLGEEQLDANEQLEDCGIMTEQANFDEVMVWGHEALLDASTDPCVRGLEEWIALAEQIHSYSTQGSECFEGSEKS